MPPDTLHDRCRAAAEHTLAGHDWRLASGGDADFVAAVVRCREAQSTGPPAEATDRAIVRAVRSVYSRRLYEAYKQDGSDRQMRAMIEVKRFVLDRLRVTARGDERLASECADDAVSQAWLHWRKVRDPERFLGFVLQIGVNFVLAARKPGPAPLAEVPAAGSEARGVERPAAAV